MYSFQLIVPGRCLEFTGFGLGSEGSTLNRYLLDGLGIALAAQISMSFRTASVPQLPCAC